MSARKRINRRQWFHRLIHRKCWNCNVPLEVVATADGRRCPLCLTFYGETVLVAHEAKLRRRILAAVGHSVSSPRTERVVAEINANLIREGRRPASAKRRPA